MRRPVLHPVLRPEGREALLVTRGTFHGEAGRAWVDDLPALVAAVAERWSLTIEPHYEHLSCGYVAPVRTADGSPAVLKLVPAFDEASVSELEALHLFDGPGAVRVLAADAPRGVALMERLEPGEPLSSLRDDDAKTEVAAEILRAIQRDPPSDRRFPAIADWFAKTRIVTAGVRPRPPWLDAGLDLATSLLRRPETPLRLLHGDFRPGNILSSRRGWVAIDPKGVIGEAAWEIGPYLYNDLPPDGGEASWRRTIRRRAEAFAEALGLDRQRVHACGAAYGVLYASWCLEHRPVRASGFRPLIVANELAGIPY